MRYSVFIIVTILLTGCINGAKFVYNPNKNICRTVWKRSVNDRNTNGDVFIIPGNFRGNYLPDNVSYISASHNSFIKLIFVQHSDYNDIIFIDDDVSHEYSVNNVKSSTLSFKEYSDSINNVLNDYKYPVILELNINVHDNKAFVRTISKSTIKPRLKYD